MATIGNDQNGSGSSAGTVAPDEPTTVPRTGAVCGPTLPNKFPNPYCTLISNAWNAT